MVAGTVLSVLAFALAALLLAVRRRVSSKWIDMRGSRPSAGVVDLADRVVVVTGGNVGLGYETALDLSRRGATVVLGCRDAAGRGADAAAAMFAATGNGRVECSELDLASAESVRKFAAAVAERHPEVHALVCNAGVWVPMERGMTTPDGYEIHFAVNHLGHFLLIRCLMDHMRRGEAESRIVIVSSGLLKQGKLDMDKRDFIREGRREQLPEQDPADGKKKKDRGKSFCPAGYADSKLMNALCCKHLARELAGSRVTTYAVCPGWCRTSLGRHASLPWYTMAGALPFMLMFQRSGVQGAQNIIFATIEDGDKLQSGGFYRDGNIAEEETRYVESLGEELQRKLWALSDELVKHGKK